MTVCLVRGYILTAVAGNSVSPTLNRWRHIIVLKCLLDSRASYLGGLLVRSDLY